MRASIGLVLAIPPKLYAIYSFVIITEDNSTYFSFSVSNQTLPKLYNPCLGHNF